MKQAVSKQYSEIRLGGNEWGGGQGKKYPPPPFFYYFDFIEIYPNKYTYVSIAHWAL